MSTDGEAASAPTDPSGPTRRLATWLAEVAATDTPERVRERALTSVEDLGTHTLIGWDKKTPGRAEASVT